MFIERKQQMRFAVFFIINALWSLIMPALPCAELIPVIYGREQLREIIVSSSSPAKTALPATTSHECGQFQNRLHARQTKFPACCFQPSTHVSLALAHDK